MSQENVEFVQRGFEAYNAGDLGALRELYDPGVVWYHLKGWPEPGPSVGRDAVLREVEQLREAWQAGDRLEFVGDFVDAGDQVLSGLFGVARVVGLTRPWSSPTSSRSATAEPSQSRCTGTTTKPSKPWGCGSRRGESR